MHSGLYARSIPSFMATMRRLTLTLDPNSLHAIRYLAQRLDTNKSHAARLLLGRPYETLDEVLHE